jgi:hypothetical protein
MTSQIFKEHVPDEMFFNLLENIAMKNDKYYSINKNSYKKGMFDNSIVEFIQQCKQYYYLSKHKYLDRKVTYNSFITIVRQICNFNKITYTSQIKYDKSNYDIWYYIYY